MAYVKAEAIEQARRIAFLPIFLAVNREIWFTFQGTIIAPENMIL